MISGIDLKVQLTCSEFSLTFNLYSPATTDHSPEVYLLIASQQCAAVRANSGLSKTAPHLFSLPIFIDNCKRNKVYLGPFIKELHQSERDGGGLQKYDFTYKVIKLIYEN